MKEYNKLIRDRVVESVEKDGRNAITRKLDTQEYTDELKKKLLEEVNELLNAHGDAIIEEMADVYEVLEHLLAVYEIKEDDLLIVKAKKAQIKGKFKKRLFLIGVVDKE
ncbi:MAG: nucleoside triphosphate pyrophosphohydrolase [Erysipelotrichaceae bacterium]|nr:nucleoside triphosphate pyrophosphohydrolase [Erysipelotrichaceae bacterium]MDP3306476.1 nucleoside triphosphate pyrophosphohydrolase [Erysipelotrichaceae bacterium]